MLVLAVLLHVSVEVRFLCLCLNFLLPCTVHFNIGIIAHEFVVFLLYLDLVVATSRLV